MPCPVMVFPKLALTTVACECWGSVGMEVVFLPQSCTHSGLGRGRATSHYIHYYQRVMTYESCCRIVGFGLQVSTMPRAPEPLSALCAPATANEVRRNMEFSPYYSMDV